MVSALFAPLPPVGVTPSRGYVDVVDKSGELGPGASLPRGGETGEERLLGVAVELVDILLPLLELLCALSRARLVAAAAAAVAAAAAATVACTWRVDS